MSQNEGNKTRADPTGSYRRASEHNNFDVKGAGTLQVDSARIPEDSVYWPPWRTSARMQMNGDTTQPLAYPLCLSHWARATAGSNDIDSTRSQRPRLDWRLSYFINGPAGWREWRDRHMSKIMQILYEIKGKIKGRKKRWNEHFCTDRWSNFFVTYRYVAIFQDYSYFIDLN